MQFTKHTVKEEIVIHKCFMRMLYIGIVSQFNKYFIAQVACAILKRYMGS